MDAPSCYSVSERLGSKLKGTKSTKIIEVLLDPMSAGRSFLRTWLCVSRS
jgi:hypothetical protein